MSPDLREQLQQTLSGSYLLERELGGGGMSRVFVATEARLHRKVVIKVLSPELSAGVNAERFERKIQLAASLQQANIVPLLSPGDTNGLPYFTMPYVEGESLRTRLGDHIVVPSNGRWLSPLLLIIAAACGNPTGPDIQGQYRLIQINQHPLPGASDGCGTTVLSGTLLVTHSNAVRTLVYQPGGAASSYTLGGTISIDHDQVQFDFQGAGGIWTVAGTWSGNLIVLSYLAPCDGTITEVFERQ